MRAQNLLSVLAICGLAVQAQEANHGFITGFVYDQRQASVANAEVTATSRATGQKRSVQTNSSGVYTAAALEPGSYDLRVSAPGFKSADVHDIVLNVGTGVRINFQLELGMSAESVTVEGNSILLKTETGEVSNLVTGTQVTEIPVNGRNFTQFLSFGTGVVSQQAGRQMGLGQEGNPLMGVHGGRVSMNKFTYDGTLAMDTGGNRGLDLFPPMEAIGEVKVQKSNYGADAGGFGYSVVNVVTKSGTRVFHGDLYQYFRNDKLDARNFFANERQTIRLNNFGYTLGGPLYIPGKYNAAKVKDFFFWSQSWARRIGPQMNSFTTPPTGVFTARVPTPAQRSGDFAGGPVIRDPSGYPYPGNIIPAAQLDPNALMLTDYFYPRQNRLGALNFVYNTMSFTSFREELLKWDHNFSSMWMWTVRYTQDTWFQNQDIKRPGPSTLPTFRNFFGKPGKNLTTKLTTVTSSRTVNLLTFGYSTNQITNIPLDGGRPAGLQIPEVYPSNQFNRIPDITIAGGFAGLGTGEVLNTRNPIYTWKDDFLWNLGRHNVKFGVELIRHSNTQINHAGEQGVFNFNGGVTGNGFADFLVGHAFAYTETDTDPGITVKQWDYESYVQDDIRITSRLTFNAGLRYYLISGSNGGRAANDRISAFVPSLYEPSKAPRLLPNGQIVPGTGDPLNGLITGIDRRGLPVGPQLMVTNKDVLGPRLGMAYSLFPKTVIRGGYGINYFWGTAINVLRKTNPPFANSVFIQNTTLSNPAGGPGRLFPPNVNSLDIYNKQPSVQSWSFSIQRELSRNLSMEIAYSGTRGTHLPRSIQLNQANPSQAGNANLRRPYLGYGTISYNENSAVSKYHGMEISLVRRSSKGLLFEASYTWSKGLGHSEGVPLDSRNKDLDFGLIDLDRTHMLSVNYVWELPFFKGRRGVAAALLGGWQVSGISTFQSGLPLNVAQPGDVANFGGGTGDQRPDILGNSDEGRGISLFRYFNVDAFQQVTRPMGVGTAPLNSIRGPGICNFDVSLFKNFAPREGIRFQIGAEFFNAFNHTQFEGVGTVIGTPTFGVVTDARDPRVIQLRAKFSF